MDCSNTSAAVGDLSAMNCQRERDISYKDSQNGDSRYLGLANSLDISVSGRRADADEFGMDHSNGLSDILETSAGDLNHLGNSLSIDVHGIYVSAVNTVPGGNAVATSNIIIEPVQIIVYPSEVEEKLK